MRKMGGKTTVMIDKETVNYLKRIKRERGFSSIDEVIKWLIENEKRYRLLRIVERAWRDRLDEEEMEKLIEAIKKVRREGKWLTR